MHLWVLSTCRQHTDRLSCGTVAHRLSGRIIFLQWMDGLRGDGSLRGVVEHLFRSIILSSPPFGNFIRILWMCGAVKCCFLFCIWKVLLVITDLSSISLDQCHNWMFFQKKKKMHIFLLLLNNFWMMQKCWNFKVRNFKICSRNQLEACTLPL